MTLKTQRTSELAAVYNADELADIITYSGSDITAFIYDEETEESNEGMETVRPFDVMMSDVVQPAYRDNVIINSITYRVKSWAIINAGDEWKIKAVRNQKSIW